VALNIAHELKLRSMFCVNEIFWDIITQRKAEDDGNEDFNLPKGLVVTPVSNMAISSNSTPQERPTVD